MNHGRVTTPLGGVLRLKFGSYHESLFDRALRKPPIREVCRKKVSRQSEQHIGDFGAQRGFPIFCQFGQRPVDGLYANAAEAKPPRKSPTQRTKPVRSFEL